MAETNMKCVFCNSVLSDITIRDIYRSEGCSTCGYGSTGSATLIVRCDTCNRVIYEKEFED